MEFKYKISGIQLDSVTFKDFVFNEDNPASEDDKRIISNLNRINFFVGPNNSGKSLFLRMLFLQSLSNLIISPNFLEDGLNWQKDFKEIIHLKQEIYDYLHSPELPRSLNPNLKSLIDIIGKMKIDEFQTQDEHFFNGIFELIEYIYYPDRKHVKNFRQFTSDQYAGQNSHFEDNYNHIRGDIQALEDLCNKYKEILPKKIPFNHIFIPALRGTRPLVHPESHACKEQWDFFKERVIEDYFNLSDQKQKRRVSSCVFTGNSLYEDSKKHLLGTLQDREIFRQYEKFLSENFFENEPITIIPSIDRDVLSLKVGSEKEQPIYRLGDGLQQIIILTYPLFLNQEKNNLVFYEEPENNMHPGLQRRFLESLLKNNYLPHSQFFIVTHSNHLLDLTLDYSGMNVYTVEKTKPKNEEDQEILPNFRIRNVNCDNLSILQMLGVQNSSVFLSNKTIWVEGITDRIYIRKFLELYSEKLIKEDTSKKRQIFEDSDYSFIEYSGNNITHWSFLDEEGTEKDSDCPQTKRITYERITQSIFLISDKDKGKEKRHEKLRKKLSKNFYCFKSLEVENSFKKDILIQIVKDHYKKNNSDKIKLFEEIEDIDEEVLRNNKLGKLLWEKTEDKSDHTFYNETGSGTITNKIRFAKIAIGVLKDFDDLSEEQKELTERIYAFATE